jgi:NhaP-type Na+/H+ or K+/H+ antiporter
MLREEMMMTIILCVVIGVALGFLSSWATRRVSTWAGVILGALVVVAAMAVIGINGSDSLFPVMGLMLGFAFAATLFDPRPTGLFR